MVLQHGHPAPKVPSCFLPLMFESARNQKGRFGALFRACLILVRLSAAVMCSVLLLPFAFLLGMFGVDAASGGSWLDLSLGVLLFTWAAGGLFGLIGYVVAALGWDRKFNALCRWRSSTIFALIWGCASAAPLVIPELCSGLGFGEPYLWLLVCVWLDAIGLLAFRGLASCR